MAQVFDPKAVNDYEMALRELFEAESLLKDAQLRADDARRKSNEARQRLFEDRLSGPLVGEREASTGIPPILVDDRNDRSHMPKILAFLEKQPGKMAKADVIVDALGREKESSIRSALVRMALEKDGRLKRPKRGYYKLA